MTNSIKNQSRIKFLPPLAVFVLGPLILFSPLLIKGQALFWGTPGTQFIPWWDYAFSTILHGDLPLWNPWVGMGAPLIANYQVAIFYPPYWILLSVYGLFGITGMAWFVSLIVVFHLALSAAGTGKLLEGLGVGKLGQTIGGLAFGLSGYLVARSGFLSINAAAAWLPWMLLYSYRLTSAKKDTLVKLGVVMALQLLAGHAQTSFYSILLMLFWSIFWISQNRSGENNEKTWITAGARIAVSGLIALALSAFQLLPTFEYLMQSQRAGEYGFDQAMTYSFWPWRFLTLFVPNLFGTPAQSNYWGYGNYWEDAVYIGLLPLLFAVFSLVKTIIHGRRKRETKTSQHNGLIRFLGLVTGLGFLLALGKNTPVFPFLYRYLPTFDLFQAPTRFSLWAVMSLSLLAGIGVEQLAKPAGRSRYWANLAAAGSFAVALGAGLGYFLLKDVKTTFFLPIGIAGTISLLGMLLILHKPDNSHSLRHEIWRMALVSVVAADLIVAGWGLNPGVERDFYQADIDKSASGRIWISPEAEYDLMYKEFFKFNGFGSKRQITEIFNFALPNSGMIIQQETVNNFDPLLPDRYQSWMEYTTEFTDQPEHPIFDLMNVSTMVTHQGIQARAQEISLKNGFAIANFAGYLKEEKILDEIKDWESSPALNLILEPEMIGKNECSNQGSGNLDSLDVSQSYLKAELDLDNNSWVFWSQTWYPGWNLYLDGEKAGPVIRGNYTFMAGCIPSGKHTVEFKYQPLSIRVGAFVTLVSLTLIIAISLLKKKTME